MKKIIINRGQKIPAIIIFISGRSRSKFLLILEDRKEGTIWEFEGKIKSF